MRRPSADKLEPQRPWPWRAGSRVLSAQVRGARRPWEGMHAPHGPRLLGLEVGASGGWGDVGSVASGLLLTFLNILQEAGRRPTRGPGGGGFSHNGYL